MYIAERGREITLPGGGGGGRWGGGKKPAKPGEGPNPPGGATGMLKALKGACQNVSIEYRWAQDRFDRLPAMAADLVRRRVSVIVVLGGTIGVLAAKAATTTIPILFVTGGDPVKAGLVAGLSRPGGNITGISLISGALNSKRLELLHEVVPNAPLFGVLRNPNNPNTEPEAEEIRSAARTKGVRIHMVHASTPGEIDSAYAEIMRERVDGLVLFTDPFLNSRVDQLVGLAARHAMPAIYGYREFAAAGGLMSYGTSASEARRQVGIYAARILKGEKPGDLPVQQAVKVELAINLKTAKVLLSAARLQADEVIE